MKIQRTRSGKTEFLKVFNATLTEGLVLRKRDPARLFHLRCSQLPYCPVSVFLSFGQRGMIEATDMMSSYYFAVGNAVHTVMQHYLMQSGTLLANYHCNECGKKYPMSHTHECCGFPTKYEEVEISYRGVLGHIDAIFKDSQGRYWIVDFKTASLTNAAAKSKQPPEGYSIQVRAYAYLLWKQYGIKVAGCMLVFLPRDNPKAPEVWEKPMFELDYTKAREELQHNRKLHAKTMQAETLDDFKYLLKHRCSNSFCSYCKKEDKHLLTMAKRFIAGDKYPISKWRIE